MGDGYTLRFFDDVLQWIDDLKREDRDGYRHVVTALERLETEGPALRRPTVAAIEGSKYRNMRELRARNGSRLSLRLLFAFDPKRRAVFLVAGNKAEQHQWEKWYTAAIPEADDKYTAYLEALGEEQP